jgi:hypothetical protein
MLKMNTEKFLNVLVVNSYLDMPLMDENKIEELLVLTRDNNKMLKDIWNILNNPNNDFKDFLINVIANQIGGRR